MSINNLISVNSIYYLIGLIILILVIQTLKDKNNPKRITTALFWFLVSSTFLFADLSIFLFGKTITYQIVGILIILMAVLAGTKGLAVGKYKETTEEEKISSAKKLNNKIFLPALLIPLVTVICTVSLKGVSIGGIYILDQTHLTLTSLLVACLSALLLGWYFTKGSPYQAVSESRRLVDSIGWAAMLPQMLAMLGGVLVVAQTGDSVKQLVSLLVNPDSKFLLVAVYCIGMALLTMIMGNAFAAFPIMTAGIALPFLIIGYGVNPAPVVAIGMYAGYCGTLMTPMAANFNIVPAALLELKDKYLVIKTQIPSAILILGANILLMYFIIFN